MAGQTVVVSVLADTARFSKAMKSLAKETGMDKVGEAFKSAGKDAADFLGNVVKVTAGVAAATAGLALKGGLDRLLNIEDAKAALSALGNSQATVAKIMDSALASVKGTSFGLGDAANVAATAVAAGIKPGNDLTRTLKLTANTAALAKTGLGEMGSILNKVWANGRVSTEELNQLADRGIPIFTKLAEHYGVTGAALRKMVENGQVDAATFESVLEGTVGPAADALGKTTRGSLANVQAALSRLGAGFLTDTFPLFAQGFQGMITWLDGLTPAVAAAGTAFGSWVTGTMLPAVKSLGDWISTKLWPALKGLWDLLSGAFGTALKTVADAFARAGVSAKDLGAGIGDKIVSALTTAGPILAGIVTGLGSFVGWIVDSREPLGAIASAVGAVVVAMQAYSTVMNIVKAVQIAVNIVMAANPIGLIVLAVVGLVAAFVYLWNTNEGFRNFFINAWNAIKTAAEAVGTWFTGTLVPWFQAVWAGIQAGLAAIGAFFTTVWTGITTAVNVAVAFIQAAIAAFLAPLQAVWAAFWGVFGGLITAVWGAIVAAVQFAITLVQVIVYQVFTAIQTTVTTVWDAISLVISTVWNAIVAAVTWAVTSVQTTISTVWDAISTATSVVWGVISGAVSAAWTTVTGAVSGAVESIKTWISDAWDRVKQVTTDAWGKIPTSIQDKITEAVGFVAQLPQKALDALGDIGGKLKRAGEKLIQGFIDGLTGMFGDVKTTLNDLTAKLTSWKGPASRDATLLKGSGQLVIEGFITGLESRYGAVKDSLRGLTSDIANTPMTSLSATVDTATLPRSTAGGYGTTGTGNGPASVALDDASLNALASTLVAGIVAALWPAAQAAQILADFTTNGPTRVAKGLTY